MNELIAEPHGVTSKRFPNAPSRIVRLPTDRRGFPVPWFVLWREADPQFPVIDSSKLKVAWKDERCWVCGDKLGAYRSWVVGPMSVIEGATPEPPNHHECAVFSVTSCPHLATPLARYSETYNGHPDYGRQANISRIRTGAVAIWTTKGRGATPFPAGSGLLFGLEEPSSLDWYAAGKPATADAVRAAIAVGLPVLLKAAETERRTAQFERRLEWLEKWIPAE
jgi:hypothetical protein